MFREYFCQNVDVHLDEEKHTLYYSSKTACENAGKIWYEYNLFYYSSFGGWGCVVKSASKLHLDSSWL